MAFKDILLTLTSYPDPTPPSVAEEAVAIAAAFGAHLTAVACEVHVEVPGRFLSGAMANIPGIIAGETQKSRDNAKGMLAAFNARRGNPEFCTKPNSKKARPSPCRICWWITRGFTISPSCRCRKATTSGMQKP